MTQNAVVTKILDAGFAEVSVQRESACGGNCGSCGAGCSFRNIASVTAINKINAELGDNVIVESKSSKILFIVFLVYLMPLILFVIGYVVASALSLGESLSIIISIAAFFIGVVTVVFTNRKIHAKVGPTFVITGFC